MGWKGEFGVGCIRITRHGMLKKKGEIAILKILRIIRRLFRKEVNSVFFSFLITWYRYLFLCYKSLEI